MNYNIQSFLREIALSETYQRSFDVPAELASAAEPAAAQLAEMKQQLPALETGRERIGKCLFRGTGRLASGGGRDLACRRENSTLPETCMQTPERKRMKRIKPLTDVTAQQQTKQNVAAALQRSC